VSAFSGIKEAYIESSWDLVAKFPGIRWLIGLAPTAQQREIERYGDAILLFGTFFRSARVIMKHFRTADDEVSRYLKFVTFQSRFEGLLSIFLFVQKLHSRYPNILSHLDANGNWAMFLSEMRSMMQPNKVLWDEISRELQKR
jgi:hypothetical protein